LATNEITRQCRQSIKLIFSRAILDHHVLALDVAGILETLSDTIHAISVGVERRWGKDTDHRHRPLLHTRRKRPGGRCRAE